jgi:hypothetical protein
VNERPEDWRLADEDRELDPGAKPCAPPCPTFGEMTLRDVRVIPWGVSNEEYQQLIDAALDHAIEVTRPVRGGVNWFQHDNKDENEEE